VALSAKIETLDKIDRIDCQCDKLPV